MEEHTSSFANRDDPIPVIKTTSSLDSDTSSGRERSHSHVKIGKREAIKREAEKLKGKLHEVGASYKASQGSVQERLVNTVLEQVFPTEVEDDGTPKKDYRSREYVDRPNFSLPAMSTNFRRFNARIGIAFVFQNRLIHLFTWREPTHTLSFLAIYTLVTLQPSLLPVVPLAAVLFFVMIPTFLARHPPPPTSNLSSVDAAAAEQYASYGYSGPAVAPPQRVKPAPEMSKDFFRNMRDLQNCMEDFSRVHDAAIALIMPYTDFSDEALSSTIFILIALVTSLAFVAAHLVPWRAIALVGGWVATCAAHPAAQDILTSTASLQHLQAFKADAAAALAHWVATDIAPDEPAEVREVEIFELQHQQKPVLDLVGIVEDGEWEPWLFSSSAYAPTSPVRIAGARPTGTQFFEEVAPPAGWSWRGKKWTLDLGSREWVEERFITGVEVETDGERWVYDIGAPASAEDVRAGVGEGEAIKKLVKQTVPKSWEEGDGRGRKGEWRRRRWVRLVERKVVKVSADEAAFSFAAAA